MAPEPKNNDDDSSDKNVAGLPGTVTLLSTEVGANPRLLDPNLPASNSKLANLTRLAV